MQNLRRVHSERTERDEKAAAISNYDRPHQLEKTQHHLTVLFLLELKVASKAAKQDYRAV